MRNRSRFGALAVLLEAVSCGATSSTRRSATSHRARSGETRSGPASDGVLFDDSARKALRLPTSEGRYIARDASDVILSLEATWPFFIDALITTWWYDGSPDAAAQMALVDGEALAIFTAVQGATNTLVSRERPYGQTCGSP